MFNLENIIENEGMVHSSQGTKLAKIVNEQFQGFFDKELHREIVFEENDDKILKKEYVEISDIFWNSLLEGQSQGKEIRFIVETSRLGLYEKKQMPNDLVQPKYNYQTHFWEEEASLIEQLEYLDKEMVKIDMKMMEKEMEIHSRGRRGLGAEFAQKEMLELQKKLDSLEKRHLEVAHRYAVELEEVV